MNRAGDEFLTGSALPADQHCGMAMSHAMEGLFDLCHSDTAGNELNGGRLCRTSHPFPRYRSIHEHIGRLFSCRLQPRSDCGESRMDPATHVIELLLRRSYSFESGTHRFKGSMLVEQIFTDLVFGHAGHGLNPSLTQRHVKKTPGHCLKISEEIFKQAWRHCQRADFIVGSTAAETGLQLHSQSPCLPATYPEVRLSRQSSLRPCWRPV